MSQSFGTPNTQSGFTLGTATQPTAGGTTGGPFGAAAVGAGDANKPLGLPQTMLQTQVRPGLQGLTTPSTGAPTFSSSPSWAMGFGTPASGTSGFSISQPNTATPATTGAVPGGLTFGTPIGTSTAAAAKPAQSGFPATGGLGGFTASSTTPGFTFGTTAAATAAPTLGFNLGGTTATSGTQATTGVQFGTPTTNVSSTATPTTGGLANLTFGTGAATTSFNLSSTSLQTAPSAGTSITATTPAASAAGGFNPAAAQTQPAQTTLPGFNLGVTTTTTPAPAPASVTSGFNLGTPASGNTFAVASAALTTAAPSFNLGATTTTTSTPGFTLGRSIAAPASTIPQTSAPQTTLGTATNVTSSTVASNQPTGLNFCQLEEFINKWTLELEEQEKAFVNQATQVNAWDRLLIANGEKIVTLNQEVERVKLEQQQLEHELDYVVGQQRELQDCLVPLEKELGSVSASDPEREYTYRLAENLDTQLKQMSEDLKEIIEHLNEANRSQDSSDPIVQIGKILNAHMNSLQWLDQRTALLQTKIQQVDQLHQNFRQEHERSFNLAYN